MAHIKILKPWERQHLKPIEEKTYFNRREILKQLGFATGGLLAGSTILSACGESEPTPQIQSGIGGTGNNFTFDGMDELYPATFNPEYTLDRPLTDQQAAATYNNFYEFIHPDDPNVYNVFKYIGPFDTRDWQVEVSGLAGNTGVFHLEDIIKQMDLEERTYRHRCVEAWAMAVPWTGFPLSKLIEFFAPQNKATHIRMITYSNPDQMIGVATQDFYPWPYFEGLRMEEAMNELSFIATGIFGKPLPKQHGAPWRLVVPWKYGYKSIKSMVKIEFVDFEPETFWHQVAPIEFGFLSNVNPEIPHPNWSQATERLIPDNEIRQTVKYNGYGEYVAHMYE